LHGSSLHLVVVGLTIPYPIAAQITCDVAPVDERCQAGGVKASRWEILGAWLRIWTPPRDVEIPPVPRRAAALVAALCVGAIVVGVTVIAPAIDRAKQRSAAQQARSDALFQRRERARLARDQRPVFARAARAARLHRAGRVGQARDALLADAQRHIARDARARVAAGTLEGPVRSVRCRHRPGDSAAGARVRLACLAITSQTAGATVGQPFTVAGSLHDGRYAWCHENPRPAEGASGTGISVPLPASCRS
jgi:hypothetical protein